MPDSRSHRGAHPEDAALFAPAQVPGLRAAVGDYAWLLSRGYAEPSALKVVGDRYGLTARQRTAVMRCTCTAAAAQSRRNKQVAAEAMVGQRLWVDGYNVLTTVETALAGGVILVGQDGSYRDMASMHGTWRKVEETMPAIELVGRILEALRVRECLWLLDSPVSNSGRLKAVLESAAAERGWNWQVELWMNPDQPLSEAAEVVATADSVILDRCAQWFPLARYCAEREVPGAWVVDLSQ